MDLLEVFACVTSLSFQGKFYYTMALPVAFVLLVLGAQQLAQLPLPAQSPMRALVVDKGYKCLFVGMFCFYPLLTTYAFRSMQCTQLGPSEHWMSADMSIACSAGLAKTELLTL